LRELGVGAGDRVGIFMPLTPECAVATLACSRIGAIFTPIFSGYGAEAVATRLQDADAKLLITRRRLLRRGKVVEMKRVADEAAARSPSVRKVLVLRRNRHFRRMARRPRRLVARPGAAAVHLRPAGRHRRGRPYMLIYTSRDDRPTQRRGPRPRRLPDQGAHDLAYCFDVNPTIASSGSPTSAG
jgi:acetyl-CoA synthetase